MHCETFVFILLILCFFFISLNPPLNKYSVIEAACPNQSELFPIYLWIPLKARFIYGYLFVGVYVKGAKKKYEGKGQLFCRSVCEVCFTVISFKDSYRDASQAQLNRGPRNSHFHAKP